MNLQGQSNPSWGNEKNLWKSDHLNTGWIIPQYNFHQKISFWKNFQSFTMFLTLYKIEFERGGWEMCLRKIKLKIGVFFGV